MSMQIKFFILLATIVFFFSCVNREEKTEIERVALGYIESTTNNDFDAASQYATKATQEVTFSYLRSLKRFVDSATLANSKKASFGVNDVKITSDTTALAIYHKKTSAKDYVDTLTMVKENGEWKVNLVIEIPPIMQMLADSTLWNQKGSLPSKEEVLKMKRARE